MVGLDIVSFKKVHEHNYCVMYNLKVYELLLISSKKIIILLICRGLEKRYKLYLC